METPSFRRILELFEAHGVEYVVVGGVAAVLQGAPVTTFDIDALVRVNADNADRLVAALTALDARYREQRSATLRPSRDDILAGGHLLLLTDSGPLDVLGCIGRNRRYEDLAAAAEVLDVGGLAIPVLGLEALIDEKRALARDKDQAMLRMLEELLRRRGQGNGRR